jgi:chromosome segregation ATPase
LWQTAQETKLTLASFDGGNLRNAIAREAVAVAAVPASYKETLRVQLNLFIADVEAEVSELQAEKETLQGTVKELKAAKKVSLDLDRIKPEETMMGNIKGITLKEVKQLKALAVRGAEAEQTVKQQANTIELQKAQITSLERQLRPSIQKRLKEAQELSDLKDENMALEYELNRQKDLMARLMQRVEAALNFLEEKLPEQFRPYVQRARAHIMPEPKQKHRHDRGMSMGGMER